MAGNDATFLDAVSPEFNKQILQAKDNIILTAKEMRKLVNLAKGIKFPSQLKTFSEKATANLNKTNKALNTNRDLTKKLVQANQRLADAQSKTGKEIIKVREQTNALNRVNRKQAREQLGLVNAYQKLNQQRTAAQKRLQNLLSAEKQNTREVERARKAYAKLNARVQKVDRATDTFTKNIGNYPKAMGGAITATRQLASALGLVGGAFLLVNGLRNAVGVIRDYEKQNATLAGVLQLTTEQTKALREESQRLGSTTVKTASEVTELQIAYARLGFSQQEIIDLTEATIQGSIAMNAGLSETAQLTGAIVNSFDNLSATDAPEILDILSLATAKSALNFEKLSVGLPIVAGAANALDVPLTEVVATLGKLEDAGIETSTAATSLRNIFIESSKRGIDYKKALSEITKSQDKLTTANKLFGKRAAVSALVVANNTEKVEELDLALQGAAGTAEEMAKKELNTLDGSLKLLKSAWEAVILRSDEAGGITEKLTKAIRYLAENLDKIALTVYKVIKSYVLYRGILIASNLLIKAYTVGTVALRVAKIALAGGIGKATRALRLFNMTAKGGIFGALLAGLSAAVALWLGFKNGVSSSVQALKDFQKEAKNANKEIIKNDITLIESQLSRIDLEEKNEAAAAQKKIDIINKQQQDILSGKADFYENSAKITEEGEKKDIETEQKANRERMQKLVNNQDSVLKILKEGFEKGKKLRIATNKDIAKAFGEEPLTLDQKLREDRVKALEDVKKKLVKQLSEIETAEQQGNKTKEDQVKLIQGSVKWYQAEINKLKELRDSQKITNEEYNRQTKIINDLVEKLEDLQTIYNDLESRGQVNPFELEQGGSFLDYINEQDEALKNSELVLESYKNKISEFLDTFSQDFIQNTGLNTTFDILNGNITGFGENAAVTFNAIAESAQEVFSFITQASNDSFQAKLQNLEQEKEISLLFAGESAAARERVEENFEEERKRIENERAKKQKDAALFNIAIDTAQGIVATIGNVGFPAAIPLIALIGAIGAAQAAFVSSQQIPQFKDGHLAGTHEGLALVNDGGRDEFLNRRGRLSRITGRNVLLNMEKGDKIYKSQQQAQNLFNRELESELFKNDIYASNNPIQPKIEVINNGITKNEMQNVLRSELSRNASSINFDEKGFSKYSTSKLSRQTQLNNKKVFKITSV